MQQRTPQEPLAVPGGVVTSPGRLPGVCVKHGLPAVRRADFALQSRTHISGSRALSGNLFSVGNRLGQWAQQVQITHVRGWPLCRRCSVRRTGSLTAASIIFWGGLGLLVTAFVARALVGHNTVVLGIAVFLGFALPLLAVVPFVFGSLPRLTQARTSADGDSVLIDTPHARFAEQMAKHDDPQRRE